MNIESSVCLDILSFLYLMVLLIIQNRTRKTNEIEKRYFHIILAICTMLVLDACYLCLSLYTSPVFLILQLIVKTLYFTTNIIVPFFWADYVLFTIFGKQRHNSYKTIYISIAAFNLLLLVVNLFSGCVFEVSADQGLIIKPLMMWIFTLLNYSYVIFSTILLLIHKKKVSKLAFMPMLVFALPPLIAEFVHIFVHQLSLISVYSISALIIFQSTQNSTIYTDELTGLSNRRMLIESLKSWFDDSKGQLICGAMLDLDGLKRINDTYGHLAGDEALIAVADVIFSSESKGMISARYGGDEFVIIWLSDFEDKSEELVEKLNYNKERVNRHKKEYQKIDFSVGTFCCGDSENFTYDDFLMALDERMYDVKNEKKKLKN